MDYDKYAEELIKYMIINERSGQFLKDKFTDISKGELAVLNYLTDGNEGACAIDMSHYFSINTSRVTAILNSLSKKNWIERQTDIKDRRKIHVYLTELGKNYVKAQKIEIISRISKVLSQLSENEVKEYIRIMKKITSILEKEEKQ